MRTLLLCMLLAIGTTVYPQNVVSQAGKKITKGANTVIIGSLIGTSFVIMSTQMQNQKVKNAFLYGGLVIGVVLPVFGFSSISNAGHDLQKY